MLPIRTILDEVKIRIKANESYDGSYTDEELLMYVNSAIRFIRRTILKTNPMFLTTYTESFETTANQDEYELENNMAIIVKALLDNKTLNKIDIFRVKDHGKTGVPTSYWVTNNNIIHLYPVPEKQHDVCVYLISSNSEVGTSEFSPFPDELDDFITEYVVTRAQMGYWFDVSQESSLMKNIYSQIVELVTPYTESFNVVESY